MKKITLIMGVLAMVAFSFTSCKKEYKCKCTWTDASIAPTEITLGKATKADAKIACEAGNISGSVSCELE
ncbi:MAG: hypothetical protein WCQ95_12430 [Bacteroidota bacterium]